MFDSTVYIDFHHHGKAVETQEIRTIQSIDLNEQVPTSYFIVGRHPWNVKGILSHDELQRLGTMAQLKNCLALGEMGLDRVHSETYALQKKVFLQQLALAEDLQLPVIIHCVKAFDDLLESKKRFPGIEKWAIHGFTKHPQLAKQLIDAGCYLSLNPLRTSNAQELLQVIPKSRLFLETDDSGLSIVDVYIRAAEIEKSTISDLVEQLSRNATTFFEK